MSDTFPTFPTPPLADAGQALEPRQRRKRGPNKPKAPDAPKVVRAKRQPRAAQPVSLASAYELGLTVAQELHHGEAAFVIRAIQFVQELPPESQKRVVTALARVFC